MGTCCSQIPQEHSYSAISANDNVPNNVTVNHDLNDDDNIIAKIHSESRSLINTSESKDSEEDDEEEEDNLQNMDLHDIKLDDDHLIDFNIAKVDERDEFELLEDESTQLHQIPKPEATRIISPKRSTHSPNSMDDMIKLSVIDPSKPQSKENVLQPSTNTAKPTQNISQITSKSAENMPKSMDNALKSIKAKPITPQTQMREDSPKSSLQNTIKSMSDTPESVDNVQVTEVTEAMDESKDSVTSPTDEICIKETTASIPESKETEFITQLLPNDELIKDPQNKRRKSAHSLYASMRIIDDYRGNDDIHRLRKMYMKKYDGSVPKIKQPKSRRTVRKSIEIIANHKNLELLKLKKKFLRKQRKEKKRDNETNYFQIQQDLLKSAAMKRRKSAHSVRRSSAIINEYKGNNDIWILRKKYMEQYHRNSIAKGYFIPKKPRNIDAFMNHFTLQMHDVLCEYICSHTHYVGMAEFEDSKEACIEIKFTANASGNIKGKRVMINKRNVVDGKAKIYKDVIWNNDSNKYEGCIRFEWIDVYEDLVTKLVFNTNNNYLDMQHLYFEGNCYQYRAGLVAHNDVEVESMNKTQLKQVRKGVFNMVCISMRKRDICKRDALHNYHEIDIWRMNEKQLQIIPKYIKCMNITSVKMHQAYAKNEQ